MKRKGVRQGKKRNGMPKEAGGLEERLRRCLGAQEAGCEALRPEGSAAARQSADAVCVPPELLAAAGAELAGRARRSRIGFGTFVLRLLRYEGLRIWLCQALALAGASLIGRLYFQGAFGDFSARGMGMFLCAFSALAALLSFPLTGRGRGCRMRETELASRYGLAKLAAARVLLAGAGNLALLCAAFGMAARASGCDRGSLALYLLVPFLGAGCLGAGLNRMLPEAYAPAGWCAVVPAVLAGIVLAGRYAPAWFEQTYSGGWTCVSAVLLAVYADQMRRQCRRAGLADRIAAGWSG